MDLATPEGFIVTLLVALFAAGGVASTVMIVLVLTNGFADKDARR